MVNFIKLVNVQNYQKLRQINTDIYIFSMKILMFVSRLASVSDS